MIMPLAMKMKATAMPTSTAAALMTTAMAIAMTTTATRIALARTATAAVATATTEAIPMEVAAEEAVEGTTTAVMTINSAER